jgi:endonuclease/exonuclease/phosphatase (EEP) superfamily protein YafD
MAPLKIAAVALGLLALPCAVAALGALGGGIDPTLDVLSNAAPLYLVIGLAAMTAAWGAAGRLRGAILATGAIAALAGGVQIAPEFLRSTGPAAAANASGQIKLIELNAWRDNTHLPQIADWLAAQHPDVVVLVECGPRLRDAVLKRLGWRSAAGYMSSTMILTPSRYLVMTRPAVDPAAKLTFVNATYASGNGPLEVVATHLGWPGRQQAGQRRGLGSVLAKLPTDRMILAGDFNSTPWSFARREDDKGFGLIRRDRAMWSWPAEFVGPHGFRAPFPFLPIDHIYAGPGWATVSISRGPRLGSDHYPLIAIFAPVTPSPPPAR